MENPPTTQHLPGGHVTVLLHEAVDGLQPRPEGTYIDGTFGGGGHSSLLLERTGGDVTLLAIDADPDAILRATILAESGAGRDVRPVHANFREIGQVAAEQGISEIDGVLLDLGLSSFQLDQADRGFAFRLDGPLDMRFDPTRGPSAADLVNTLDEEDLADIFWRYGEERQSRRIARAIVAARAARPIETTGMLAALIEATVGGRRGKGIHPATRAFQGLRIAVNDELVALQQALDDAITLLGPGGRLVVISFHSLEDRIVKQTIARETATCICPPDQPVCTCDHIPRLNRIGKPIRPGADEIAANPRSRSAIMRVAERVNDPMSAHTVEPT